jgi:autotransporter strand-loop-strand O-heptosyltransferase
MKTIDVICLTNTKDDKFYGLTNQTIKTLLKSEKNIHFNINLIESNSNNELKYNFPDLKYIKPNETFNYNRFLNIGLKNCNNDWVLIMNNDINFTEGWLSEILKEHEKNPDVKSFSPFDPIAAQKHYPHLYKDGNLYIGYKTPVELMGWCILVKKEVLDLIGGFDEQFDFWFQDDDYGQTLKSHNILHGLVKSAVVYHFESSSHNLLSKREKDRMTTQAKNKFNKKWKMPKYNITQVTPGMIPIPPNGWGAVEKIIWAYKLNLEKKGNVVDIHYLNGVDKDNTDIVHIHIANLAIEAHERGIPYIFSLHDHHVVHNGKDSPNYRQNLEAIKKSVVSITHAEFLVDYFEETDKLFYLPHGVDTNYFVPCQNKKMEHSLLCLANNGIGGDSSYDRKGFLYAIDAAKELNLPITIAGPKNNLEFFKHYPEYLKYEKLTLKCDEPSEEEILSLYQNHTIFLHPSALEAGHPNLTILEALSCGLPVVGTYSGTRDIDGMIRIQRDNKSVIDGVKYVIENYDNMVKKTELSREYYNWGRITDKLYDIYCTVKKIKSKFQSPDTRYHYISNYEETELKPVEKKDPGIAVFINYVDGPFLEIKGNSDKTYKVQFLDEQNVVQYENHIKCNMWVRLNRKYYTKWTARIYSGDELIFQEVLNLENQRVFISFDSSSLGDTLAWFPFVEEFRKKHNCKLIVSTFWNKFFVDQYPYIEFVKPGSVVNNLMAMYTLGWFYDSNKEPEFPSTVPLQKTATNILGLEYKELLPDIKAKTTKISPRSKKYVTIATHSTAGLKYWNNPDGWADIVNFLKKNGYDVVHISKEPTNLIGVEQLDDTSIENTINYLHHSEFFIGLSSGLSWLAWAMRKRVIMISNFTEADHEFSHNCDRIINTTVCHGCWNNPLFKFDKGNWNWCPEHEGTDRQFECHKQISSDMVINAIKKLI